MSEKEHTKKAKSKQQKLKTKNNPTLQSRVGCGVFDVRKNKEKMQGGKKVMSGKIDVNDVRKKKSEEQRRQATLGLEMLKLKGVKDRLFFLPDLEDLLICRCLDVWKSHPKEKCELRCNGGLSTTVKFHLFLFFLL